MSGLQGQTLPKPTDRTRTLLTLPNILTIARIFAVPLLIACLFFTSNETARLTAFALFIFASATDWLDGYLARRWQQLSALGTMLDPIADKLLVGAVLMMLVADQTISGMHLIAAIIILCREILVSGLREFMAGAQVSVPVTQLAKWKTTLQMVALALLILAPVSAMAGLGLHEAGLAALWGAGLLTLWTGGGYLMTALDHAIASDTDATVQSSQADTVDLTSPKTHAQTRLPQQG